MGHCFFSSIYRERSKATKCFVNLRFNAEIALSQDLNIKTEICEYPRSDENDDFKVSQSIKKNKTI